MSSLAIIAAAPPRRRPGVVVLAFWLAVGGLIVGQFLPLRYLGSLHPTLARTGGQFLLPSPWWRVTGTLVPLLLAGTALVLQLRWLDGAWSALAGLAMVAFVPFAPLCLLLAYIAGPHAVETLTVRDGGSVILAVDDTGMDDIQFVLFEEADPGGFVWRQVSELDDIEDPPRAGRPQLVTTLDGQWLLVRRNGMWTDGFRLVDGHPVGIDNLPPSATRYPNNATLVRRRSERIAALTGLRP